MIIFFLIFANVIAGLLLINLVIYFSIDLVIILSRIEGYKYELWNTFFNLDNPIFKQSNYSFDYRISTDCFSVFILLLHSSFIDSETLKKLNMKKRKKK